MPAEPRRFSLRALRGMATVAATYFAFLLFAQFAFVEILRSSNSRQAGVQTAMAVMGLVGLATSLWAGRLLARYSPRRLMVAGFVLSALSAAIAAFSASPSILLLMATSIGMGIALLTVAVATDLPRLVPGPGRGLKVGVATGSAYFACNLPFLFDATPAAQSLSVAAVCALSVWIVPKHGSATETSSGDVVTLGGAGRMKRLPFLAILLSFLALVWLDSAAFNVIQETVELKGLTWGEPTLLVSLGITHLLAAALAGALIDRGRMQVLLLWAFALFVTSFTWLASGQGSMALTGPLYAIGISFYSVALVTCPSASASGLPVRWRAAWLYGIAGWIGSALGVGMAQDLHRIPVPFLLAAGGVLLGSSLLPHLRLIRRMASAIAPTAVWTLGAMAVMAMMTGSLSGSAAPAGDASPIERGREVYIGEGCISCHSQFVRPGTPDEDLWGPARDPHGNEQPPLIGMRRQGPDLLNAGNRRSAEWHRLHLMNPRALSPGSRMPSYAHLFDSGTAGEDLVSYLASLGAQTALDRFEYSQVAAIPDPNMGGDASAGRQLFSTHCQVCHGESGRGDGPVGLLLGKPGMNLQKGSFWLVPWGPGLGTETEGLVRVIKFGVPGTSMPGHEYFSDQEIVDLAMFVSRLSQGEGADGVRIAKKRTPTQVGDVGE